MNKKTYPKKYLGQNFLLNPPMQQKIINACELKPTDVVLEIGPGKGALTKLIAPRVAKVIAIEKDRDLAQTLKTEFENSNVTIIEDDILHFLQRYQVPIQHKVPGTLKIIGNLPYNIATAIIEKAILHRRHFELFFMTVQLEHGKRMAAQPHTKDYGSFSCFVQLYTETKILFRVPPAAFYPMPKVQSCFLKMNFLDHPSQEVKNEDLLFKIIREAFGQRRKTIENSLAKLIGKEKLREYLAKLSIDSKSRAENLSLADYAKLTNFLVSSPSL